MDTVNINTTALAYIGDAVYEVYIREYVLAGGNANSDALHRQAVRFVSAAGQAKAVKRMFDSLDEDEQALVRRARNHKSASRPKNTDPMVYKWATALEALIGSVHLQGNIRREREIISEAIRIIQGER